MKFEKYTVPCADTGPLNIGYNRNAHIRYHTRPDFNDNVKQEESRKCTSDVQLCWLKLVQARPCKRADSKRQGRGRWYVVSVARYWRVLQWTRRLVELMSGGSVASTISVMTIRQRMVYKKLTYNKQCHGSKAVAKYEGVSCQAGVQHSCNEGHNHTTMRGVSELLHCTVLCLPDELIAVVCDEI